MEMHFLLGAEPPRTVGGEADFVFAADLRSERKPTLWLQAPLECNVVVGVGDLHLHPDAGQARGFRVAQRGGDRFAVRITGPEGENVPASLQDNNDGTYRVDYAPQNAGPTRIEVTLREKEQVAASPYTVNVRAGADHVNSAVEDFWFKVYARTKRGAPLGRGGENFTVEMTGPRGRVETKLTDNGDGTLTASYKLPVPATGRYTVAVKVNGKHIANSPWEQVHG